MKRIAALVVLLLGIFASGSALAGGHYHHGGYHGGYHGGGVRFGLFIGAPAFGPWWWYSPPPPVYYAPPAYYDPPVIYRRSVTVAPLPSTVVDSAPVYSTPPSSSTPSGSASNGVIELGPVDRPAQPLPKQEQSAPRASTAQPPTPTQGQMALQAQAGHVYVYPRQGQSAQQQAKDEGECNRWASSQMGSGFDANQAVANFQRALGACLDAHGYSVR